MDDATARHVTPDGIMQLGFGFWGSKTLLSAVELGVFTVLAAGPMDREKLAARLDLHARSARDFLDALVALGMLDRKGEVYANTPAADQFLDRAKPSYVGGILEMANARLYRFWGSLTEALRTGAPQNEAKQGQDVFDELYADPARLQGFLKAMSSMSVGAGQAMAGKLPWGEYGSFVDVGGAEGAAAVQLALAHPHLQGTGFDLPRVKPHFDAYIAEHGLAARVRFEAGDFFADPLPKADVVIMGHILHDWDLAQKRVLISKAYEALPPGGSFVAYEVLIDDARKENAFGLLMSLNMLIETRGGFDFTGSDCMGWMREAGFRETRVEHLAGPDFMVVGVK